MRIGEIADCAHVPVSTIRYYERVGVLPEPARARGQRCYDSSVLDELAAIKSAQKLGFSLEEIKGLLGIFRSGGEPSEECRSLAMQKLRELDQMIVEAQAMKQILERGVTCECTSLQGCYLSDAN